MSTCMCAFAPYDIPNARAIGYDVVCNRPKVAAYRAPGSPLGAFAVESVLDVLAQKIGMDPLQLRLKNAAKIGTRAGLWTDEARKQHYANLCAIDGRILLAGEHASYWPGWQEGAILSSLDAISRLHRRVLAG